MKKLLSVLFLTICACFSLQAQSFSFIYNGHTYNHLDTMVYQIKANTGFVVDDIDVVNNTSNTMNVIASCIAVEPNGISVIGATNGQMASTTYYTHAFDIAAESTHTGVEFTLNSLNAPVGTTGLFYMLISDASEGQPDSSAGSYVWVKFVVIPDVGYVHFSEDFQNVTQVSGYIYNLPSDWSTIADNNTNYSQYSAWGQSWTCINFTGDNKAAGSVSYLSSSTARADRWLITPRIHIPYTGLKLTFAVLGYSDSYPESIRVYISTTGKEKSDFTSTNYVLNLNAVPAGWNQYMLDLNDYVGDSIYIAFLNRGTNGYYTAVDDVVISMPANNEIELTSINLPNIARGGSALNISGTITNLGVSNVNSYEVYYIANGDTSATYIVNNVNVPYGSSHNFTHNVPYTSVIGSNNITVVVAKPNDVEDDPSDNVLNGVFDAYDPAGTTPRKVLMENFTTGKCPNCPSAHTRIHNAIEGLNDVIWVAHHVGYYTDDMTITESNQLIPYYNDGGNTYAPALMLDRTRFDAPQWSDAAGPVFFPGDDVADAINLAREQPAFVDVYFPEITYDASSRQLTVKIAGQFVSDVTINNPRLSCYIIEDSIMASQSGVSGLFQHNNVIRACLSNVLGDQNIITSTAAGSTFEKTYTKTLPASWKYNYCRVVAFVNSYTASAINNSKVFNSNVSPFLQAGTIGINEVENNVNLAVYPNPASEKLVVETNSNVQEITITNTLGQVVYRNNHITDNQTVIDLSNISTGLYIVNVRDNNGSNCRRINVVK